jgi:hypothetical protein
MTELVKSGAVRAQQAQDAIRLGFPITCATCEHLYIAWDKQADDCGKTATCGGPIFGRNYPDYKGPLTPEAMERLCLICGSDKIDFHVLVGRRRFGLCVSHRGRLDHIIARNVTSPTIVPIPGRIS